MKYKNIYEGFIVRDYNNPFVYAKHHANSIKLDKGLILKLHICSDDTSFPFDFPFRTLKRTNPLSYMYYEGALHVYGVFGEGKQSKSCRARSTSIVLRDQFRPRKNDQGKRQNLS